MNRDHDIARVNIKQHGRFDKLQAFIDQRGGVEGIHLPHGPGGMSCSLLRRGIPHLLPALAAEGPAGRGKNKMV